MSATETEGRALVMVDRSGIIRHLNDRAETWFGYPAATALGQTLDLIVPRAFQADHWKGFHRAVASGSAGAEAQATPFPVQCADGAIATFRGQLTLLRDPDGSVIGAIVVFAPNMKV